MVRLPELPASISHHRVAPEVVMQQGELIATLQDARLFGAVVGAVLYFWRHSVLLTIVAGMAVYLPLHLVLGW